MNCIHNLITILITNFDSRDTHVLRRHVGKSIGAERRGGFDQNVVGNE